ncbi:MAG: hypothetical protein A2583_13580 [Bdellovibrionales bacterium RIFOXYD1_FULL_53_11]|nr:MAG: hypothetical protein A2583_13580 [Bdellovibrionales bacterium RIFOXYD1_FULL_53_11]
MSEEELPIFVKWLESLSWIIQTAEKFPKRVRGTITDRLINIALDIIEDFIEGRYSRGKIDILRRINLKLEKIRVLLRIAHEQKILPHQQYKHGAYLINETGKMLGGWIKQQEAGRT